MKILVTGSTGFIGRQLCRELQVRDIEFRATSRSAENFTINDFVSCDLENDPDLSSLLSGCNAVIHLAGRAHVVKDDSSHLYQRANEFVTRRLAEAAKASGVRRFVFISSIKVNGESSPNNAPFTALDIPNPQDSYGRSKLAAENALKEVCQGSNMDFVIIRPTLVYGKGVKANFQTLIKLVNTGLPLPFASITNRRSMIGINNLIDLIILAAISKKSSNQTFLASDDFDISTPDLLRLISISLDRQNRIFKFPIWLLRLIAVVTGNKTSFEKLTGSLVVDITSTKHILSWTPQHDLQSELSKAVN